MDNTLNLESRINTFSFKLSGYFVIDMRKVNNKLPIAFKVLKSKMGEKPNTLHGVPRGKVGHTARQVWLI